MFAAGSCFVQSNSFAISNDVKGCPGRELAMVLSLDLQEFILRARVLKLYRQALRTAQKAPVHARG